MYLDIVKNAYTEKTSKQLNLLPNHKYSFTCTTRMNSSDIYSYNYTFFE